MKRDPQDVPSKTWRWLRWVLWVLSLMVWVAASLYLAAIFTWAVLMSESDRSYCDDCDTFPTGQFLVVFTVLVAAPFLIRWLVRAYRARHPKHRDEVGTPTL